MPRTSFSVPEHPLVFGSFRNWVTLLLKSRGISLRYLPKAMFVCLTTALVSPFQFYEKLRYDRKVETVRIHPSPIFIIGHWRSGTTHLQNLICQDPNFGYITTFQAMAPGFFLSGNKILKPLLERVLRKVHPTRLIDNIPLSFDSPMEDDFAVANLSPYSFLHQYFFPQQATFFQERYALFNAIPENELTAWTKIYLDILRRATLFWKGKRLVSKNPANSGRIPALLKLFPEAKFIHICRNPYQVYLSTLYAHRIVLPKAQVQKIDLDEIKLSILRFYSQLMRRYLTDKETIPSRNLVEIKFEELEHNPIEQLSKIYQVLELPGFPAVVANFRKYLDNIKDYQKNEYHLSSEVITLVNQHWGFAFDAWGYEILPSLP